VSRVTALEVFLLFLIGSLISGFEVQLVKPESTILVPDDYSTIQEAINNAIAGDTILVSGGPYVENLVINKSVALIATTQDVIIRSLTNSSCTLLVRADNVTIIGFKIDSGMLAITGIILRNSSYVTITGNFLDTVGEGIKINGGSGNTIVHNEIADCTSRGITMVDTNFNLIMGNSMNCHQNSIKMLRSHFNHIYDNLLATHWGTIPIYMSLSNQNTIEENILRNDSPPDETYIELYNSNSNLLFHNNAHAHFITGVILGGSNIGNQWDNGQEGNYWSDYTGNDSDGDGVGDTPLVFDGNNTDNYPLMNPHSRWNVADVNFDFKVDILDAVLACMAYGSTAADSRWDPYIDLVERHGFIDIFDITTVCQSYGDEYTP